MFVMLSRSEASPVGTPRGKDTGDAERRAKHDRAHLKKCDEPPLRFYFPMPRFACPAHQPPRIGHHHATMRQVTAVATSVAAQIAPTSSSSLVSRCSTSRNDLPATTKPC